MPVVNVAVGAVSPTTAWVRGKVTGVTTARLAVSLDVGMTSPTFFDIGAPTADGVVSGVATGLTFSTQYYFALELDSVIDTTFPGKFRTHPAVGSVASFAIAAAGDAGLTPEVPGVAGSYRTDRISDHLVFDTIRTHEKNPLFFAHLGDMHYYNPGQIIGSAVADFRRCWDDVLLQPRQHNLYRNMPLVWIWDDHDYGPNDSDGTFVGKANGQQVYRERVPHYPLAEAAAIYHSFQVGRVLFVALDNRSYRSPKADPDGPSKTMLGAAQKAWLEDLLTTSDAAALVVLNQQPWTQAVTVGSDAWGGYNTERQELADMFGDLGWTDRMCMLGADAHTMAFDSGASNQWGGFPTFLLASMDSTPSGTDSGYDLGISNGRNRYGVLEFADNGNTITITATGYIGAGVWRTHTFITPTPPPSAPVVTPPPALTPAVPRTHVTWYGCDLVSGRIIAELPDLTGTIGRVLGAYTSVSLSLPIPLAGPGALGASAFEATAPGVTMIVPVVNDAPAAGFVVLRRTGGTGGVLQLGCVSLEGYLERRYVGDHTWTQQDEAAVIAAGLAGDANVQGIGLVIDAPATGTLRDRSYFDKDDAKVYARLQELMAVDGGPEWTVDVDWADADQQVIAKILRVRKRIGAASTQPNAVFDSRGDADARYTYDEDYGDGRGANHVTATSSGEGEDRPQSTPAADIRAGWPRYEQRYSPSSSITDPAVLGGHAAAELTRTLFGARTLAVTARWDATPRLNVDWRLGDDVGVDLRGHRHRHGLKGQGRVVGWELDLRAGVVTPILLGEQLVELPDPKVPA